MIKNNDEQYKTIFQITITMKLLKKVVPVIITVIIIYAVFLLLSDVDKIIDKIQPELVYVDMIRTSQYIENYDIYKVIDIDDLLSIRYQRPYLFLLLF